MMPETYRELLSAYVDGELSVPQRRTVQRLLEHSPEAREYLRQLQVNANHLRNLPRRRLATDLSGSVLNTIRERGLRPGRLRLPRPVPVTLPAWISVASAAAVLLMVTATSYLVFADRSRPNDSGAFVQGSAPSTPANDDAKSTEREVVPETVVAKNDSRPEPRPTPKASRPTSETPKTTMPEPPTPEPEPEPDPVVAAPIPKLELFQPSKLPAIVLPSIYSLEQFEEAKLRADLGKDTGFRLELPVKESVKAYDRLQTVLKASGPTLVLDPNAQFRLRHPQLKTNFVVYTEAMNADEWVKLLARLAVEDRKAEAKKRGDGQFESVVLTPLSKDDDKELSDLLGVDPQKVPTPPKHTGPLGVDIRKPLSEGTADQVAEALKNGGSMNRGPERLALVLPYNPVRPRAGSAELKRFVESLRPSQPGTIRLLLVLRETRR